MFRPQSLIYCCLIAILLQLFLSKRAFADYTLSRTSLISSFTALSVLYRKSITLPDISQSFETKQYKTHSKRWFLIIKDPIDPTINTLPISRSLSNDHLMVRTVKNLLSSELTANYYVEKAHTAMGGDPYYDPPVYADGQVDRVSDPEMRFALFNRTCDENISFDGNQRHYTAMVFYGHDEAKKIYTINDLCPTWLNESSDDDLDLPFSCGNTFLWKNMERVRIKNSLALISVTYSKSPEGIMMVTVYFPDGTILYTTAQNYRWMKSLFYELNIDFEIHGSPDFVRGPHKNYYQKVVLRKPSTNMPDNEPLTDMDNEKEVNKKVSAPPTQKNLNRINNHPSQTLSAHTSEVPEIDNAPEAKINTKNSQQKNTDIDHYETITQEVVDVFIELIKQGDYQTVNTVLRAHGKDLLPRQHSEFPGDTALHAAFKYNNKGAITILKEYCTEHGYEYRYLTGIKNRDNKIPFQLESTLARLSSRVNSEQVNCAYDNLYGDKKTEDKFFSTINDSENSQCITCLLDEDITFNFSGADSCKKHGLCTICMQELIQLSSKDTSILKDGITCPEENCNQRFQDYVIRFIGGDEILERINGLILTGTVLRNGNLFQCLNPSCNYIVDLGENPTKGRLTCPQCKSTACVSCKVMPYHENYFCSGFQATNDKDLAEKTTKQFIKNNSGQFKECPTCQYLIYKEAGCNYIKCIKCKTHFCWFCNLNITGIGYGHFQLDNASDTEGSFLCPFSLNSEPQSDEAPNEVQYCQACEKNHDYMIMSCGHRVCNDCYAEMQTLHSLRPDKAIFCSLCVKQRIQLGFSINDAMKRPSN